MDTRRPEDLHHRWVEGINNSDLDALVALYEPDAAFVVRPGDVVTGQHAIRDATAALLDLKPHAELEVLFVTECGDVALVVSRWRLSGSNGDGPVEIAGQTSDVARKQSDLSWRFVIDNPWGDAAAGA